MRHSTIWSTLIRRIDSSSVDLCAEIWALWTR